MIIKKFQGATETEAILAAKEEMGSEAVVMNIKTIKPKGIFSIFRKSVVEITAALEEKDAKPAAKQSTTTQRFAGNRQAGSIGTSINLVSAEKTDIYTDTEKSENAAIEEKLQKLQSMLEKQIVKDKASADSDRKGTLKDADAKDDAPQDSAKAKNLSCLKLVYNKLIDNEVAEVFANQIISEVENSLVKEAPLDNVLAAVYQKIVLKLGEPVAIEAEPDKKKIIFLVGPTGVGKTTTIAKLASSLKLNKKAKVALMTSDTYRIAAVEQLRTYANILDVPLSVVYTESEVEETLEKLTDYDIVLVDTAGRSHRDTEQCEEIFRMVEAADPEKTGFERDVYLVVSATTKYRDLVKITKAYEALGDYKIIFTKLDETFGYGNIINIAMLTGKSMSYTTFGQNVPDDIDVIDVQEIAKQLLGGGE
ncbi:MAG: flagellar biosynthesis protein FlhF [Lachnospiraceae bacterium]|nr:flagellar biosynthesis protein FlhF [Lachnospiraceae bacterium]